MCIRDRYTADGKGYKGYSNGSFFIGEDLSMFTWRLKEYAGVHEKGEYLFYKNVKDEAGNITGRETTTNHACLLYTSGTDNNATDIILMRVEEMYLIKAEAQAMSCLLYTSPTDQKLPQRSKKREVPSRRKAAER